MRLQILIVVILIITISCNGQTSSKFNSQINGYWTGSFDDRKFELFICDSIIKIAEGSVVNNYDLIFEKDEIYFYYNKDEKLKIKAKDNILRFVFFEKIMREDVPVLINIDFKRWPSTRSDSDR